MQPKKMDNANSHKKLEEARKESPCRPSKAHSLANTMIADSGLQNCQRINFFLKKIKTYFIYYLFFNFLLNFFLLLFSYSCLHFLPTLPPQLGRGVFRNYYKGHMDKTKGEGASGGGRWVCLGWGGENKFLL